MKSWKMWEFRNVLRKQYCFGRRGCVFTLHMPAKVGLARWKSCVPICFLKQLLRVVCLPSNYIFSSRAERPGWPKSDGFRSQWEKGRQKGFMVGAALGKEERKGSFVRVTLPLSRHQLSRLRCLCVCEAPKSVSRNVGMRGVRRTEHLLRDSQKLHCSCCSADACTGVGRPRMMDSLKASTSAPVCPAVPESLFPAACYSALRLCCSATRFAKWTVAGPILPPPPPTPTPLLILPAICSGKIH